jgi:hypothetical protein
MTRLLKSLNPALIGALVLGTACSDLTSVTNTGFVQPTSEANSSGAVARYAGATLKFVSASISGINNSAVFSDEWINADFPGNSFVTYIDARRAGSVNFQTGGVFTTYSTALINIRFAEDALRQYAPTPSSRIAQMLAYSGYMELFLAEHFCNGVPFSTIDESGSAVYGPATSRADVYARAIAHFDSAAALSADSARVLNLTRIGKARALLGMAKFPEAAAAVAGVPTTFTYNLEILSSVTGQTNTLYSSMIGKSVGVPAGSDGVNGINWVAANDPRVKTSYLGKGTDGATDVYQYLGYNSLGAPIPIANGIEARLIEAEAALQANRNDNATTGTGWLGILNSLRTTAITPAMPSLADPGSFDARVNLLFRERAFWLYLTAHRMGDMRRLVRQYGRTPESVFPTGQYHDGVPYGTELNLIPPNTEAPNTNYQGCIDRNA